MPTDQQIKKMNSDQSNSSASNTNQNIPFCLQRIFFNLQLGKFCGNAVRTHELLQAFGWGNN
jgi:hypothetical protein